jgi:beta-alanine--pyruvate transaminase
VLRNSGDALTLSPPLIVERAQIDEIAMILGDALKRVA